MESKRAPWLPRALVESGLIVMSILMALALDEWKEDQEIQELIDRSVLNFSNELTRNHARIQDVRAYHQAVGQILKKRRGKESSTSVAEFRNIMDAMQPIVLTSSAWQTAVATGSLTRMNFDLVSALSLTYNTQIVFNQKYNSTLDKLLSPSNLRDENLRFTIHNASGFLEAVASSESELSDYYAQTLELLLENQPEPE